MKRSATRYLQSRKRQVAVATLFFFIFLLSEPFLRFKAYAELYSFVTGTLTDANTGAPLANMEVMGVSKTDSTKIFTATTNTQGRYSLRMLPPGTYQLFFDEQSNYQRPETPPEVTVIRGKNTINANFALQPGSIITGKITTAQGTAPNSNVFVSAVSQNDLRWFITPTNGNYALQGLRPKDVYFVVAVLDGQYATYATLETDEQGQARTNFNLSLGDPSTGIQGTVTSQGSPLSNVEVWATSNDGLATAHTDTSGNYKIIGLKDGHYDLIVHKNGYELSLEEEIETTQGQFTNAPVELIPSSLQSGAAPHLPFTRNLALRKILGELPALANRMGLDFAVITQPSPTPPTDEIPFDVDIIIEKCQELYLKNGSWRFLSFLRAASYFVLKISFVVAIVLTPTPLGEPEGELHLEDKGEFDEPVPGKQCEVKKKKKFKIVGMIPKGKCTIHADPEDSIHALIKPDPKKPGDEYQLICIYECASGKTGYILYHLGLFPDPEDLKKKPKELCIEKGGMIVDEFSLLF